MTMRRRTLLASGLAAAVAPQAFAQSAWIRPTYDVVKVMSFTCGFCAQSESQDALIEAAIRPWGGKYLSAPIPASADAPGYRERAYYAARDFGPQFAARVKAALYKGSQERGLTLSDFSQVYHWLVQEMPDAELQLDKLITAAQAPEAAAALDRAVRLTVAAGVQLLPTYVVLERGTIQVVLDSSVAGTTSMSALREALLRRIDSMTANEPKDASNSR